MPTVCSIIRLVIVDSFIKAHALVVSYQKRYWRRIGLRDKILDIKGINCGENRVVGFKVLTHCENRPQCRQLAQPSCRLVFHTASQNPHHLVQICQVRDDKAILHALPHVHRHHKTSVQMLVEDREKL